MITVSEKTAALAWESCFIQLIQKGIELPENAFFKNDVAVIEIEDVENNLYNELFPIPFDKIKTISDYFIYGTGIAEHKWTQIYRERIFKDRKIEKIINLLKSWPDCPRAQISIWNNIKDIKREEIAPCLQMLWFKIINNRLVLHVHMRTCDCYGKLLININEFISLQKMVSKELNLESGQYVQFIDSLHFHKENENEVKRLFEGLTKRKLYGKHDGYNIL